MQNEGCAQRTCTRCRAAHHIADSQEIWDEANPETIACPCGASAHQIAVAFSLRANGAVKWITVEVRCAIYGVLGASVEWKIDYEPTEHLLQQV